jgi:large subunit ribosomal protein L3
MKVGMLPIWDKWGERHAVTVLQLDECEVVQVKREETDGYTALQLGVGEAKSKRVKISAMGHYKRANVKPKRKLAEFRVTPDSLLPEGTRIRALHFLPGQFVDVCGISKGKGFQGVMKRWNFGGGRATHGNSLAHRIPGSTGCRQDPGRVFKNKKMPGRMGGERTTMQNLRVMKIDPLRDLLFVKGTVPGNNGTFVRVVDAVKGPFYPSPPPFPTYQLSPDDEGYPKEPLVAPESEADKWKLKEPEDAI